LVNVCHPHNETDDVKYQTTIRVDKKYEIRDNVDDYSDDKQD